ncbi:MAG: hypothetical protein Q8S57_05765 [Methanoregula sp.]|nr:hypothetical protein [Methanoregula sp.]
MYATILSPYRVLRQLICGIIVVACILTWCRFAIDMPGDRPATKTQFTPCLVFSILSIYGTLSDGKMLGALLSVREPGLRIIREK